MSHDVGPVQLSDIQEASEYMKGKLQPTPLVQLWDHKDVSFLHLRSPRFLLGFVFHPMSGFEYCCLSFCLFVLHFFVLWRRPRSLNWYIVPNF